MSISIKGDKELIRRLKALEKKDCKAAIRKGCRAGAKIILSKAKSTVSVKTGAVKANLTVRALKRSKKRVGVAVEFPDDWYKGDQYYFSFVEFGWKWGRRRMLKPRKQIAGKHQLANAAKEAQGDAYTAARIAIGNHILKVAKRGA